MEEPPPSQWLEATSALSARLEGAVESSGGREQEDGAGFEKKRQSGQKNYCFLLFFLNVVTPQAGRAKPETRDYFAGTEGQFSSLSFSVTCNELPTTFWKSRQPKHKA